MKFIPLIELLVMVAEVLSSQMPVVSCCILVLFMVQPVIVGDAPEIEIIPI